MSKHPLDDHFGVHEENLIDGESTSIEIPEDPELRDLDMVILLALQSYKDNQETMEFIEPKNKLKYMEMQRDLLTVIKDSRYKRDKLILDRERMERGAKTSNKPSSAVSEDTPDEGSTYSRKELESRLRAIK